MDARKRLDVVFHVSQCDPVCQQWFVVQHRVRKTLLRVSSDITQKGYEKKRAKLIGAYLPQPP
ncbi:hypothetical protein GN956_G26081, partial [Arapaima gigas]